MEIILKKIIKKIKFVMGVTYYSSRTRKRITTVTICVFLCVMLGYFMYHKHIVKRIFKNINSLIGHDDDVLSSTTLEEVKSLLKCSDKDFESQRKIRGEFWVLKNFFRAEHDHLHCYETVTLTTHATIDYLDHLEPLVERWKSPVSLAIHAPGSDFDIAAKSILYLRQCSENSDLITQFVTFHIFFSFKHIPTKVPDAKEILYKNLDICTKKPPFLINPLKTYMQANRLLYPINTARNIARDAAMTHFILSSDIDFYPSPRIPQKFLRMIARNAWPLNDDSFYPRVFPLPLFQMKRDLPLPVTHNELQVHLVNYSITELNRTEYYHNIPDIQVWIAAGESEQMTVLPQDKNWFKKHWSPIFIGTHQEPHFDDRLSWEGLNDRTSQAYIMCIKDYKFLVLSDAYLIHSYNIKPYSRYISRDRIIEQHSNFFDIAISPQLMKIYGSDKDCQL